MPVARDSKWLKADYDSHDPIIVHDISLYAEMVERVADNLMNILENISNTHSSRNGNEKVNYNRSIKLGNRTQVTLYLRRNLLPHSEHSFAFGPNDLPQALQ